jgi:predicted PurR-regulated permease PerM
MQFVLMFSLAGGGLVGMIYGAVVGVFLVEGLRRWGPLKIREGQRREEQEPPGR